MKKRIEDLDEKDLETYSIWEYFDDPEGEYILVEPVKKLPLNDLSSKLISSKVSLANGMLLNALLGNISLKNKRLTQHFITLEIFSEGKRFHLARYHDIDADTSGPKALADFLNLKESEIFPIQYNLSSTLMGDAEILIGEIPAEPKERLTMDELMDLTFSYL